MPTRAAPEVIPLSRATNFDPELPGKLAAFNEAHSEARLAQVFGSLPADLVGGGRPAYRLPQIGLQELSDHVALLASHFAEKFGRRMGRSLEPFTPQCVARLKAYHWPGNVRELENVIERAVITAREGRLDLDRALPETLAPSEQAEAPATAETHDRIRTVDELRELERQNLARALEQADWKVSGEKGAARRLGMKPSTVHSRMKALGIRRPHTD